MNLSAALTDRWHGALNLMVGDDPEMRAEWDVENYLAGRHPSKRLIDSIMSSGYGDAFVESCRQRAHGYEDTRTVLANVVALLPPGWSEPEARFTAILDFLQKVGRDRIGAPGRLTTGTVLAAVVKEIADHPDLVAHPAFQPWLTEIEAHHPELLGGLVFAQIVNLRPDETLEKVSRIVARALRTGKAVAEVIEGLRRSTYRPDLGQLPSLTAAVVNEFERTGPVDGLRSYSFGYELTKDILGGGFGQRAAAAAREQLPGLLAEQLVAQVVVLRAVALCHDPTEPEILISRAHQLTYAQKQLGDVIEVVDKADRKARGGLLGRLTGNVLSSDPGHRHGRT